MINSCLKNRWQREQKSIIRFSSWSELLLGVPQGSGDHYFDLNDLFYLNECTNVCSYADDTTFHACNSDLITRLEHDLLLVTEWFQVNYIELNEEYTSMNCYGQTTEGVKFGKVKNKKFLDLNLHLDEYIFTMQKKLAEILYWICLVIVLLCGYAIIEAVIIA